MKHDFLKKISAVILGGAMSLSTVGQTCFAAKGKKKPIFKITKVDKKDKRNKKTNYVINGKNHRALQIGGRQSFEIDPGEYDELLRFLKQNDERHFCGIRINDIQKKHVAIGPDFWKNICKAAEATREGFGAQIRDLLGENPNIDGTSPKGKCLNILFMLERRYREFLEKRERNQNNAQIEDPDEFLFRDYEQEPQEQLVQNEEPQMNLFSEFDFSRRTPPADPWFLFEEQNNNDNNLNQSNQQLFHDQNEVNRQNESLNSTPRMWFLSNSNFNPQS